MNNNKIKRAASKQQAVNGKNLKQSNNLRMPQVVRELAPVAHGLQYRSKAPNFKQTSRDSIIVRHREYLQDVSGSVAFTAITYSINPALIGTFPWLYSVANQYESYLFRKLHFIYEPACSTSTAGTIILCVDYDATDAAPSTKSQAMTYHNAVRSAAWEPVCYKAAVEDLSKFKRRYTRAGALPANADVKMYDVGNLFLCTSIETGTAIIGELYVEYEVELQTPQQNAIAGQQIGSAYLTAGGTFATATPFGSTPVVTAQTGGVWSIGLVGTSVAIFCNVASQFLVEVSYSVSASGTVGWTTPTLSNCAYVLVQSALLTTTTQTWIFTLVFSGPGYFIPASSGMTNSGSNLVNAGIMRIANYTASLA
jgi:hypothetical protein